MTELLLGSGSRTKPDLVVNGQEAFSDDLVRLDISGRHGPDVVWDLNVRPLPFSDASFDRVYAFEVLEHIGRQGDYQGFFDEWNEYHRILKPGGLFIASVPHWQSQWAWADPGHTRILPPDVLTFLMQEQYEKQIGKTPMADYRDVYHGDFELEYLEQEAHRVFFVLKAKK